MRSVIFYYNLSVFVLGNDLAHLAVACLHAPPSGPSTRVLCSDFDGVNSVTPERLIRDETRAIATVSSFGMGDQNGFATANVFLLNSKRCLYA